MIDSYGTEVNEGDEGYEFLKAHQESGLGSVGALPMFAELGFGPMDYDVTVTRANTDLLLEQMFAIDMAKRKARGD